MDVNGHVLPMSHFRAPEHLSATAYLTSALAFDGCKTETPELLPLLLVKINRCEPLHMEDLLLNMWHPSVLCLLDYHHKGMWLESNVI